MATNVIFSISKPMFEVLDDIAHHSKSGLKVYVSWYDKRTLNALASRDLIKFTQARNPQVRLTKHGTCLIGNLKNYIQSRG